MRPTREVAGEPAGRAAHPLCLALLRVGFAKPYRSPCTLVRSYRTVAPLPVTSELVHRRSLSVALSVRSPRPGSRQHSALWSPDFPRHGHRSAMPRSPGRLTVGNSVRPGQQVDFMNSNMNELRLGVSRVIFNRVPFSSPMPTTCWMDPRLPNWPGIAVTLGISVCGGGGSPAVPPDWVAMSWTVVVVAAVVEGNPGSALTASVRLTRPPGRAGLMLIAKRAACRASRAPTVIAWERSEGSENWATND